MMPSRAAGAAAGAAASAAAPSVRRRIGLLVVANYLASVGGGRVLSAGKGLTGIKLLGSGSLVALVVGSVLSLIVLHLARRLRNSVGLVWVSAGSAALSVGLLCMYWNATAAPAPPAAVAGGPVFAGSMAWLFFLLLVVRCALWMAGRALRTGLVSAASRPGLALSEAAYFGGLVSGLMMGLPALLRADPVASAFELDIGLLVIAALIDVGSVALARPQFLCSSPAASTPTGPEAAKPMAIYTPVFFRLTAAYATATIGCQIVIFQLADTLARSSSAAARAWADPSLAAFYVGVAGMAVGASVFRPILAGARGGGWLAVSWHHPLRGGQRLVPVALLCVVSGAPIVLGLVTVYANVPAKLPVLAGLAAIGAGSGLFEILALAILAQLAALGQQAVAAALGVAATAATAAMLLMLAAGPNTLLWTGVNAAGLIAAAWLIKGPSGVASSQAGSAVSRKLPRDLDL